MRAGSDASDDRELNATAWAGATARANARSPTPPLIAATGYSASSNTTHVADTKTT